MRYDTEGFVTAEDGSRLFYGVRGSGPTVVLCDGIGCDGYAWEYLQPYLSSRYQVVHWHYRGHGRSGPPADPARTDISALARDLLRLCDHLAVEEANFFGHSMGVQVVLELYRLAPERIRSLGLFCGSSGRVTQTFHGTNILAQILPSAVQFVEKRRPLARALWGWIPPKLAYRIAAAGGEINARAMKQEDFSRYWRHMALMEPDLFLDMLRAAGEHNAADLLPSIRTPTLVLAAERDTFTPPELAKRMADLIPGAEHVMLPSVTHAAPVESPQTFNTAVGRFLESLPTKNV